MLALLDISLPGQETWLLGCWARMGRLFQARLAVSVVIWVLQKPTSHKHVEVGQVEQMKVEPSLLDQEGKAGSFFASWKKLSPKNAQGKLVQYVFILRLEKCLFTKGRFLAQVPSEEHKVFCDFKRLNSSRRSKAPRSGAATLEAWREGVFMPKRRRVSAATGAMEQGTQYST